MQHKGFQLEPLGKREGCQGLLQFRHTFRYDVTNTLYPDRAPRGGQPYSATEYFLSRFSCPRVESDPAFWGFDPGEGPWRNVQNR